MLEPRSARHVVKRQAGVHLDKTVLYTVFQPQHVLPCNHQTVGGSLTPTQAVQGACLLRSHLPFHFPIALA
jgi:hypothetical protein